MCKCTPEIKAPFCGKGECKWKKETTYVEPEYLTISARELYLRGYNKAIDKCIESIKNLELAPEVEDMERLETLVDGGIYSGFGFGQTWTMGKAITNLNKLKKEI